MSQTLGDEPSKRRPDHRGICAECSVIGSCTQSPAPALLLERFDAIPNRSCLPIDSGSEA